MREIILAEHSAANAKLSMAPTVGWKGLLSGKALPKASAYVLLRRRTRTTAAGIPEKKARIASFRTLKTELRTLISLQQDSQEENLAEESLAEESLVEESLVEESLVEDNRVEESRVEDNRVEESREGIQREPIMAGAMARIQKIPAASTETVLHGAALVPANPRLLPKILTPINADNCSGSARLVRRAAFAALILFKPLKFK